MMHLRSKMVLLMASLFAASVLQGCEVWHHAKKAAGDAKDAAHRDIQNAKDAANDAKNHAKDTVSKAVTEKMKELTDTLCASVITPMVNTAKDQADAALAKECKPLAAAEKDACESDGAPGIKKVVDEAEVKYLANCHKAVEEGDSIAAMKVHFAEWRETKKNLYKDDLNVKIDEAINHAKQKADAIKNKMKELTDSLCASVISPMVNTAKDQAAAALAKQCKPLAAAEKDACESDGKPGIKKVVEDAEVKYSEECHKAVDEGDGIAVIKDNFAEWSGAKTKLYEDELKEKIDEAIEHAQQKADAITKQIEDAKAVAEQKAEDAKAAVEQKVEDAKAAAKQEALDAIAEMHKGLETVGDWDASVRVV